MSSNLHKILIDNPHKSLSLYIWYNYSMNQHISCINLLLYPNNNHMWNIWYILMNHYTKYILIMNTSHIFQIPNNNHLNILCINWHLYMQDNISNYWNKEHKKSQYCKSLPYNYRKLRLIYSLHNKVWLMHIFYILLIHCITLIHKKKNILMRRFLLLHYRLQ